MDKSKYQYQDNHGLYFEAPAPAVPRPVRRDRVISWSAVALGIISLLGLALHWSSVPFPSFKNLHLCNKHGKNGPVQNVGDTPLPDHPSAGRVLVPEKPPTQAVPLEAHIMSKCPDAQYCIQKLVIPVMEQISDKVDFKLSFIAHVSNDSSDVECMHGPSECIGDMLMLCAANLPFSPDGEAAIPDGPRTPTIRSLGFANCLIGSYPDIPKRSLVEVCTQIHGIDFDALNECASQQDDDPRHEFLEQSSPLSGIALLRKSARHSAQLGVRTSCTLRLDDSVWCVRDGGVWKDCAEEGNGSEVSVLVQEIERLWEERN